MASALIRHVPILDESPEDRRVALTKRLPSLSNYLATDVSAWAWHMSIVRDHELWRETDATSWEDYCTRIVGKPLEWCRWIIGGYESLRGERDGPIPEADALSRGMAVAEIMARSPALAVRGQIGRGRKGPASDVPAAFIDPDGRFVEVRADKVSSNHGNNVTYLAARIKRDHPDIAAAVARGEYRSMRQAALAAGIVKPPDPLRQFQRLWEKMLPEERDAVEDHIANWRRQNHA